MNYRYGRISFYVNAGLNMLENVNIDEVRHETKLMRWWKEREWSRVMPRSFT